jgi:hypothetical protein
MARFEVTIDSPLPAPEAWRRVLDLRTHGAVIPLTTVSGEVLEPTRLRAGTRFVARTGLGPIGFDDPMVIESYAPPTAHDPGIARIRKEGNVVTGRITLRVTPSATGSVVGWRQRIRVRGVPDVFGPVVARLAEAAYRRALEELLRRS